MSTKSKQELAEQAAEALSAEGIPVTTRAVRERAGVAMEVAMKAARSFNSQATGSNVPEVPDSLQVRFRAIWAEAVAVARQEHNVERAGFEAFVKQSEEEREELAEDLAAAQTERDEARAEQASAAAEFASQIATLEAALRSTQTQGDRIEARLAGRLDAVEGERDRLISERDRVRAELDRIAAGREAEPTTHADGSTPASTIGEDD